MSTAVASSGAEPAAAPASAAAAAASAIAAPLMAWSVRDQLLLTDLVLKHGTQNWPLISRHMRAETDSLEDDEWFSAKQCARQYSSMIDKAETPNKRTQRSVRGNSEADAQISPEEQAARSLRQQWYQQLQVKIKENIEQYRVMKEELAILKKPQALDPAKLQALCQKILDLDQQEEALEQRRAAVRAQRATLVRRGAGRKGDAASPLTSPAPSVPPTPAAAAPESRLSHSESAGAPAPKAVKIEAPSSAAEARGASAAPTAVGGTTSTPAAAVAVTPAVDSAGAARPPPPPPPIEPPVMIPVPAPTTASTSEQPLPPVSTAPVATRNATAIIAESANKAAEASQDTATPASAADVRDGNHKDHTAADASHAAATAADVSMEDDEQDEDTEIIRTLAEDETPGTPAEPSARGRSGGRGRGRGRGRKARTTSASTTATSTPTAGLAAEGGEGRSTRAATSSPAGATVPPDAAEDSPASTDTTSARRRSARRATSPSPADTPLRGESESEAADGSRSKRRAASGSSRLVSPDEAPASATGAELEAGAEDDGNTASEANDAGTRRRANRQDSAGGATEPEETTILATATADEAAELGMLERLAFPSISEPLVCLTEDFRDEWELHEDDTEEERAARQKAWKASILNVWRQIGGHKDANLFRYPVKEEHAPGYYKVVHRPMDLQTIKQKIDAHQITTTRDFEHAVMLMLNNAIMYNSKDHFVHIAAMGMREAARGFIENYRDAMLAVQMSETERETRGGRRTLADDGAAGSPAPPAGRRGKKPDTPQDEKDGGRSSKRVKKASK